MQYLNKRYDYTQRIQVLNELLYGCQLEINRLKQLNKSSMPQKEVIQADTLSKIIENIENTLETSFINTFGEVCLQQEDLYFNIDYQTLWEIYICMQELQKNII